MSETQPGRGEGTDAESARVRGLGASGATGGQHGWGWERVEEGRAVGLGRQPGTRQSAAGQGPFKAGVWHGVTQGSVDVGGPVHHPHLHPPG